MTDKELLELAAKAAEIECFWLFDADSMTHDFWLSDGEGYTGKWNPLTEDGDAFRLTVELGLVVCIMNHSEFTGVYIPSENIGGKYDEVQHHEGDPCDATRRAIVRAAASIGKSL